MADRVTNPPADPLDLLAAQADLDQTAAAPVGPGSEGETPPPPITNAQAFAGALAAGREAFCYFTQLESPRTVLTDDRVSQLAALADPVLTKHGVNLGDVIGDWAPEFALAVATVTLVAELRKAVNAEIASKVKTQAATAEANTIDAATDGPA